MMELPETTVLAAQLAETVQGLCVERATAMQSPHKFAFFNGDPQESVQILVGKRFAAARGLGSFLEMAWGDARLLVGDGANLRYLAAGEAPPARHQLLLALSNGGALVVSVQMYGAMQAFMAGTWQNPYYEAAREKPSPLTDAFDEAYFMALAEDAKPTLSAKALLATEQRIPGLGNGVLQDILFAARIHPKRRVGDLSTAQRQALFAGIKTTLAAMCAAGGRDTERDLFGKPGGYPTVLSSKTAQNPCPVCGHAIVKQAYMGGSVYFCPVCQPL